MDIFGRLHESEKMFRGTKYAYIVDKAWEQASTGKVDECNTILDTLPTFKELLEKFLSTLQGKKKSSTYATLKKIMEGKETDPYVLIKAYSSLMTRAAISCENGTLSNKVILIKTYEKLGSILYGGIL